MILKYFEYEEAIQNIYAGQFVDYKSRTHVVNRMEMPSKSVLGMASRSGDDIVGVFQFSKHIRLIVKGIETSYLIWNNALKN